MAAKRVDPAKAKAAKQKKIAIGLVVLLVGVLVIQGPKMLNMLKGSKPAAVTATTAGGPAGGPAAGGPAAGGPAAVSAAARPWFPARPPPPQPADLASVPDSDQAPVVDEGQLATFERFSSKDPFAQQAEPVVAPPAKKPPATDPAADPAKDPKDPATAGHQSHGRRLHDGRRQPVERGNARDRDVDRRQRRCRGRHGRRAVPGLGADVRARLGRQGRQVGARSASTAASTRAAARP